MWYGVRREVLQYEYVVSSNKFKKKICEELGANVVINYNEEDFFKIVKEKTKGKGINLILDMVGGSYVQRNIDINEIDNDKVKKIYSCPVPSKI